MTALQALAQGLAFGAGWTCGKATMRWIRARRNRSEAISPEAAFMHNPRNHC